MLMAFSIFGQMDVLDVRICLRFCAVVILLRFAILLFSMQRYLIYFSSHTAETNGKSSKISRVSNDLVHFISMESMPIQIELRSTHRKTDRTEKAKLLYK